MTADQNECGTDGVDQTQGNLGLLSKFIQELLDRSEEADPIPEQATVILLPPEDRGDSALYEANMCMARTLAAEGQNVVLWTIGSGKMTALADHEIVLAAESSER